MATFKQSQITIDDVHHKTADLAEAAGDMGDDFLKYLYEMALRHIEEVAASTHEGREEPCPSERTH